MKKLQVHYFSRSSGKVALAPGFFPPPPPIMKYTSNSVITTNNMNTMSCELTVGIVPPKPKELPKTISPPITIPSTASNPQIPVISLPDIWVQNGDSNIAITSIKTNSETITTDAAENIVTNH